MPQSPRRRDPLELAIDAETDQKFWTVTGLPPGHKLDRRDPDDRKLINTWLRIRYETAQEVASRATQPTITEDNDTMAISGNFYGHGGGRRFAPPLPRHERLVAVIPPLAYEPAEVSFHVNGDTLTASICIDGHCYQGTADLAELVGEEGGGASQEAVQSAGAMIVGALCDKHQQVTVAGWWHSLTHKLKDVGKGLEHTVASTLNTLKGPIAQAASIAAGAAADMIPGAGPLLAPMASSLAKNLVDAATGGGSVKKAAQQVVQQAQAAAQANPQIAAALNAAHQAVASATTAYHVTTTVANAAAGNPDAIAQVAELATAAAGGDAAAQSAIDLGKAAVNSAVSNAGGGDPMPAEDTGADAASAAVQGYIVGASQDVRDHARDLAVRARKTGARYIGVMLTPDGDFDVRKFESLDDADDWFGHQKDQPITYAYLAYFDGTAPTFPTAENEVDGFRQLQFGASNGAQGSAPATSSGRAGGHHHHRQQGQGQGGGDQDPTQSAGWFLPLFTGAAGLGAGYFGPEALAWARQKWAK